MKSVLLGFVGGLLALMLSVGGYMAVTQLEVRSPIVVKRDEGCQPADNIRWSDQRPICTTRRR
jgi:hypothetical protein